MIHRYVHRDLREIKISRHLVCSSAAGIFHTFRRQIDPGLKTRERNKNDTGVLEADFSAIYYSLFVSARRGFLFLLLLRIVFALFTSIMALSGLYLYSFHFYLEFPFRYSGDSFPSFKIICKLIVFEQPVILIGIPPLVKQCFYLNYHKFSKKSYVLDVY